MPNERSVGFASCKAFGRSTSGIHARPLSKVRCCRPKKFGRLPEGLSHQPFQTALSHPFFVMPTSICTFMLLHSHYPLLCTTTLASLVKGRWIDGKTQALILLLSACDTSAFFIHQIFLPSRRRDCSPSAPSLRFSALSLDLHHHPFL